MKFTSKILGSLVVICALFLAPVRVAVDTVPSHISTISSLKVKVENIQVHAQENGFLYEDCGGGASEYLSFCAMRNGILHVFELIWYNLTQILAAVAGLVLDFLLVHSISSESYRSGIIEAGWEILRDFTNIIFIFALMLIAFNMVLGRDGGNIKSSLIKTILVALVINFSLFVTYTIVDSSNIFAHTFYNRIDVQGKATVAQAPGGGPSAEINKFFKETSTKSVSLAVVSQFNPQRIIAASGDSSSFSFGERLFIVFTAGALNILLIYIFISVAMLFLGRTVGIMLLGIFAPVAFGTLTIPKADNIRWIGFSTWWKQLLTLAFSAPIFLFLMYLTITFANNNGVLASLQSANPNSNAIVNLINVVLPFAIIAILLMTSLKVTKKMAGELGGMIVDYVKKGAGVAITGAALAATGGAAALGGAARGIGLASKAIPGTKAAAFSRGAQRVGKTLQSQNFNFGSNKFVKKLGGMAGVNTTAGIGDKPLSYRERLSKPMRKARKAPFESGRAGAAKWDKENEDIKDANNWQQKLKEEQAKSTLKKAEDKKLEESGLDKKLENAQKKHLQNEITIDPATGKSLTKLEEERVKKAEDRVKTKEEEVQDLRAKLSSAQNDAERVRIDGEIKRARTDIKALQDKAKQIKENTAKGELEKVEKEVTVVKKQAQEEVASSYDSKNDKIASKIRSGKIKAEGSDDKKTEKKSKK